MFVREVGEALGCGARGVALGVGNVFFLDRPSCSLFVEVCECECECMCAVFVECAGGVIDYSAIDL